MNIQKEKPIKLNISDDYQFLLVTLIVDRDDFLNDIKIVREKIGLKKLLKRKTAQQINNDEKKFWRTTRDPKKLWNLIDLEKPDIKISKYIDELNNKYKQFEYYKRIIESAILYGKIENSDLFSSIEWEIYKPSDPTPTELQKRFDYLFMHHAYHISINLALIFKMSDLDKAFIEIKKELQKFRIKEETIINIKRDRKWYWQNKNGESAYKISCKQKSNEHYESKTIEAAITQYKKLIKRPFDQIYLPTLLFH